MISNQILVAVVIPFRNSRKHIKAALKNVFAQTYEYWGLLLIDHGLTDISTQIAKNMLVCALAQVGYIEYERHQNRGVSIVRNLGISKAQEDYLVF